MSVGGASQQARQHPHPTPDPTAVGNGWFVAKLYDPEHRNTYHLVAKGDEIDAIVHAMLEAGMVLLEKTSLSEWRLDK